MENKVVIVKSVTSATVGLNSPNHNFKRRWEGYGTFHKIPLETLKEVIYEPGVEYLFSNGYLDINDLDVKIELGLEDEGAKEPVKTVTLTPLQQAQLLNKASFEEFKDKVEQLNIAQVDELTKKAIQLKVADMNKLEVLGKKSKTDLVGYITELRQEEKEKGAK